MNKNSVPVISTTLLNWNRCEMLRRTLESYRATVTVPYELFIVDNGSTDGSADYIAEYCEETEAATPILLPENRGGESLDLGIARSRAAIIHLSENDLEYLPGWCEYVVDVFARVPSIGQLSVLGPVPYDEEILEHYVPSPMYESGILFYEPPDPRQNVPTSSFLRREIFDAGVRNINNVVAHVDTATGEIVHSGSSLIPSDMNLSDDVRRAGYRVAWSERNLIRNLSDTLEEFEANPGYYEANYAQKVIGLDGWNARIERWRQMPKPSRSTPLRDLWPDEICTPEATEHRGEPLHPRLWSMIDAFTPEVEVMEFIFGLVRAVKPHQVVSLRSFRGHLATAVAAALDQNDRGHLTAFEDDPEARHFLTARLGRHALDRVSVPDCASADYVPDGTIDMVLTICRGNAEDVVAELAHLLPFLRQGSLVVATSLSRSIGAFPMRDAFDTLEREGHLRTVFLPSPRGVAVATWKGGSQSSTA